MKRLLTLAKKHYTEERQLRILGEDSEIEVFAFNGSDLTGDEDINIIQGSTLPELKAAQQDRIVSMWGAGAILDDDGQPDHKKFLRLMGMGDSNELFEQDILDINNAKMENKKFVDILNDEESMNALQEWNVMKQTQAMVAMQTGQPTQDIPPPPIFPQVWDSDDHHIHIREHNTFRKSSAYRNLPTEIRELVDIHYAEHVAAIQAPMMEQQQQMMQMQQQQQQEQMAMKQMENEVSLEKEQMKQQTQLAVASIRKNGA